jgi:hypothetical protein
MILTKKFGYIYSNLRTRYYQLSNASKLKLKTSLVTESLRSGVTTVESTFPRIFNPIVLNMEFFTKEASLTLLKATELLRGRIALSVRQRDAFYIKAFYQRHCGPKHCNMHVISTIDALPRLVPTSLLKRSSRERLRTFLIYAFLAPVFLCTCQNNKEENSTPSPLSVFY